jgi:hypothetical protein
VPLSSFKLQLLCTIRHKKHHILYMQRLSLGVRRDLPQSGIIVVAIVLGRELQVFDGVSFGGGGYGILLHRHFRMTGGPVQARAVDTNTRMEMGVAQKASSRTRLSQ